MKIAANETAFCHAKDVKGNLLYTDDNQPVGAVLYGPASDAYAALQTKIEQRAEQERADNNGKLPTLTPEQQRQRTAEDLADLTVGLLYLDHPNAGGKHGRDAVMALYADARFGYLTKQFDRFAFAWGNFAPASSGI
ncbi:hypothetical protein [uncultured Sphingomonas sp.]|uniref:hypothetical protein n=1 Tax=uncultured Sphingomonas sp. TaxID=158754 RepID=UPI0025D722CA|nr:hypothetical protein [uncultured Sphingomonas sp.]